jgi:hypothetical protein
MTLPYRVHAFWAAKWEGEEPTFAGQVVSTFNVPGLPNVGHMGLGKQGAEFTANLTAFFGGTTLALATMAAKRNAYLMQRLRDLQPITIMYRNLNYFGLFAHLYKVVDVKETECRSMVRAMGDNSMNFEPAVRLRLAVRMRPHSIF